MTTPLHFEGVSYNWEREVLHENLEEIRRRSQEIFEDAILMGCDETQFRGVLQDVVAKLENPYTDYQLRTLRAALGS